MRPTERLSVPRTTTIDDAVAEHVHGGRHAAPRRRAHALERGGARGRAAVVGPGPALHAGDAEPLEPRRAVLPRRARRPGRSPATRATRSRTSRRTPGSSAAYQSGDGRGRALVVPRVRAAARGRGARACPRSRPARSSARRWRRTTRTREVETPFGAVGLLAPLVPDVAILHAPVADEHGNVAIAPAAARRRVGRARARARGAIVTVEQVVDVLTEHSDLVRIPAHRVLAVVRGAAGRAPRRPVHRRAPGRRLRRGLRVLGRGPRRDAPRRLRRLDPRTGCSSPATQRASTSSGSAPSGSTALRAKARPGLVAASTRRAYPPDLDAPVNAWELAATFGARHLADRVAALGARRGARRRRRREPRGVARRRPRPGAGQRRAAHRRDRALGLRADARPTRSCSTTATSRRPRCSATRRWCCRRSSAVRARRRSGASAARRSTGTAT